MSDNSKKPVVLIGCGRHAVNHLKALNRAGEFKLVKIIEPYRCWEDEPYRCREDSESRNVGIASLLKKAGYESVDELQKVTECGSEWGENASELSEQKKNAQKQLNFVRKSLQEFEETWGGKQADRCDR